MRVLVIGGTEFISLHLVQALVRDRHEVNVLNRGRRGARVPSGVRTIVCDRKDWTALKTALAGERFDGLVDVTYAPTTGEDVGALLAALGGRVGHAIFVSTGRVHDHALPMPLAEDAPRTLYWGEYARLKIEGEDAYMRSGVPATVVRPTRGTTRRSSSTGCSVTDRFWFPATAAGSGSSATWKISPTRWRRCSATAAPSARPTTSPARRSSRRSGSSI